MNFFLAVLPVLVSSVAILMLRQSALRAGTTGLVLTMAIVIVWPPFRLDASLFGGALFSGLLNTLNVAYVMLGGVFLFQVLRAGGALDIIASAVTKALPNSMHCLFALVFGVSVFFESATGFGVGIIVSAPLFLAMGYQPIKAAVLALLGQGAVPWGALAIGTIVGSDLSGVSADRLGELAALIGYPFLLICGMAALLISGEWQQHRKHVLLSWLVAYVSVLSALLWLFSITVGSEMAGCLAGIIVVLFAVAINYRRRLPGKTTGLPAAIMPFVLLLFSLLASRLHVPTGELLKSVQTKIGEFMFTPIYHAGFWLLMAGLCGLALFPAARSSWQQTIWRSAKQWLTATLAVGGFLLFGQLMAAAGMTAIMAQAGAAVAGNYYAAVIPFIGGLGGFLTASNTSSNALFMTLQTDAAAKIGMPVDIAAALQNASGSNTTLASPGRLVFAASVAGTAGAESELLRQVLPVAVAGVLSAVVMSVWLV